jgi:hypothetical protein
MFGKLFCFLKPRWLKNSKGEHDAMLSFAGIGLLVSCFAILASMIDKIAFRGTEVLLKSPSEVIVGLVFGGTVTAYVMRRNKKDQFEHEEKMLKLGKQPTSENKP